MLRLNGKNFKGTSTTVKVSRVEKLMDVDDIFAFVSQKFNLNDRQQLYQQPYSYARGALQGGECE